MLTTTQTTSQPIKIKLPRLHSAQSEIKRAMRRFNIARCGRQFGKDVLGQDRAAVGVGYHHHALAWCAPSYRMLSDNYRMFINTLWPVVVRKLDNERIDLVGGGYIEFWSLEQADRIRGHHYDRVIINEAAMVRRLKDIIDTIILPTLFRQQGGLDLYSTPRGLNDFFTLWRQAENDPAWGRFHKTTYDNPYIPREEIERIRETVPERVFRQEILAEFVEDGSFFQNVERAAVIEAPDHPEQHAGHYLVMGVDFALSEDFTVLTVACRECNRVVDWQRFNQIDYTYQRERIVEMAIRWGAVVLPERNSIGEPNIEILIQRGLTVLAGPDGAPGFATTAATKPALIQGLASALEHHQFLCPQEYADELRSYEVETLASGHPRFGAPEGQHDDRVISLALAWHAMSHIPWLIT